MDTVKINIDEREVEATPDKTVIQAALESGIQIPHYCYHPKLSIAGNCRMCPKTFCGQCTPCREGCHWLQKVFGRIENGAATEGDVELILSVSNRIMGKTICPFGDAAAMPAGAFINKFRDEFEQHIKEKRCTVANGSA